MGVAREVGGMISPSPVPGRVLVCDPSFPLGTVREILAPADVGIEEGQAPWEGDDVVGLLVGPDYPVSREDVERLPALRVVATCSVGFDQIDLEAAAARGITVTNVPDYCVEEMAESTVAMVVSLLRGIVVLDRSVWSGEWDYQAAGVLSRVSGTRLGVVGAGRIGRAVTERARALGMEVWASDPVLGADAIRETGAWPAELDELLAACGAVTLHVPLTPSTRHLIGKRELGLMPAGAFLVNTARAGLVDMGALAEALRTGRLGGAAFDVLPEEPPASLPDAPRLVLTPHAAWYSEEAEREVYRRPALAVLDVLEGREPRDAVALP
jgi:D-3-phosphoglycerate dehydrogenase / 2-oxoglutarate reductase